MLTTFYLLVGSTERDEQEMYVLQDGRIVEKKVLFSPGLFKIYDEILVNAADNKQRDPKMDKLEINIDPEKNEISVKNNGKGIPVVIHKEHNIHVPTMIFGTCQILGDEDLCSDASS
jgi:DNA topoisomerase-2